MDDMTQPKASPPPTVGRVVHFHLDFGPHAGEARRADVVRVDHVAEHVELAVTLTADDLAGDEAWLSVDRGTSQVRQLVAQFYARYVHFDPDGKPGTWRYPPVVR